MYAFCVVLSAIARPKYEQTSKRMDNYTILMSEIAILDSDWAQQTLNPETKKAQIEQIRRACVRVWIHCWKRQKKNLTV